MLRAFSKRLFDREEVTLKAGFLPKDPQRIICDSWIECARVWFR